MRGIDKTGRGFQYLRNKFPNVSDTQIKRGGYVYRTPDQGTDIRQTVR